MLKEFINADMSCKLISLDELIQMQFNNEDKEEVRNIYENYDIVCLRIGTVVDHSYSRYVLEKFYNSRKNNNKYGLFTSRLDMDKSQGLYGKEICKIINDGRRIIKIEMRTNNE